MTAFYAFGQFDPKSPRIEVAGESKISVHPDLGVLILRISSKNLVFNQTITGLNAKTNDVSKQIVKLGFKEDEIKTTDFQIVENKIYRRDEYIDSGYIAYQSLKVEFKNQKETITKILNAFSKSSTDFTLSFDFKLSEELKSKTEQELIRMAISDCRQKATLISTAAGVKLKRIDRINYGTTSGGPIMYENRADFKTMAARSADTVSGFIPNDVLLSDNISIIWEIE